MTSTTACAAQGPTVEHRAGRRLRHLAASVALVVAVLVAGGAVLAATGLAEGGDIGAAPADGVSGATPVVAADDDAGERGPAQPTDDGEREESDAVPTDEADPAPVDEPKGHLDDPSDEAAGVGDTQAAQDDGEDANAAEGDGAGDAAGGGDDAGPVDGAGLTTVEVQEKLREYGFLSGPADGTAGQQTTAAVMAFQRVNGLAVDGVVGPKTIDALIQGSADPTLRGGPDDRIEVDLDRQLLHLVEGGELTVTLQVSSGNGETYASGGGSAVARTPVGEFRIERRIHGLRQAPLGTLYDPLYFHRGFAIHGSPSVPAHPASHGCVRVTRADASWLIERIPDGMPVHLYGGTHVFTP